MDVQSGTGKHRYVYGFAEGSSLTATGVGQKFIGEPWDLIFKADEAIGWH